MAKWCPFVRIKDYQDSVNRVDSPGVMISTDCYEDKCAAWAVDVKKNEDYPRSAIEYETQPGRCGMLRSPAKQIG